MCAPENHFKVNCQNCHCISEYEARLVVQIWIFDNFICTLRLFLHSFSNFLNKPHYLKDNSGISLNLQAFYRKHLFPNFQIICSRRKIIYTFTTLVAKLKEMKCPSESTKSLTSLLKVLIYFFLYIYDNRPWHFFRCPFFVLFGCTFACHFLSRIFSPSRPRERKRFFMPLQEFEFYFKTGKNLWFALKNAFDCFWLFKRWKLFWKHSKMTL